MVVPDALPFQKPGAGKSKPTMSFPGSFVGGALCAEALTATTALAPSAAAITVHFTTFLLVGDPRARIYRADDAPAGSPIARVDDESLGAVYRKGVIEESRSIDVTLEPLDDFVVIQPVSDETETRSGLILPASAAAAVVCRTGIVTAIGSDVTGVDAGDKVLYPGAAGYEVRLGGIEVRVLKREDLIARIHD
jgi:chaperonin GroES